jgi:photoactive yellow protein
MNFADVDIMSELEALSDSAIDRLPFGVVTMNADGIVVHYNTTESTMAGLSPERVVGLDFFTDVAPCTNNYMVAGRYEEAELDETLDYVFTLRMKPTPVKLRLLKSGAHAHQYMLVARR